MLLCAAAGFLESSCALKRRPPISFRADIHAATNDLNKDTNRRVYSEKRFLDKCEKGARTVRRS